MTHAIRRSSSSQANTSTATWADLPEKAEAKDAAGAEASEEVEMDVDAAGAAAVVVEEVATTRMSGFLSPSSAAS